MPEMEGKGLDYERYAMNKLFARFVADYGLKRVLEIPAKGEKAMPSIYSLPFGAAGCDVTLVNAEPKSKWAWEKLGFGVDYAECDDLTRTGLDGGYDLVWNFMQLSQFDAKSELVREMARLSRKYILFVAVNRFNPGFFSHRTVHRWFDVPWNHGDIRFMNVFFVKKFFREQGLKVVRAGVVDTPPYPDSLGIRDMKLHRKNVDLNKIDWDSRSLDWMQTGEYPLKIRLFYFFEWLPMPYVLKLIYAHLFWVLVEK